MEGRGNPKQPVDSDVTESFVIKGLPPRDTRVVNGWNVPSKDVIETFFGESGKHWTPEAWASLLATKPNQRTK